MIGKHKSEWSYKWAKIKSDYEKFIKYHYPDAEDDKIQERLDEIKAKYDALYDFWGILQRKGIFKTDTFWYFEPFAWVEQMKRVFDGFCPDDCSQCFDYQDVWDNPEISADNGGKNNNRYGKGSTRGHKGVDIVSGPTYKEVHSLMCGVVEAVVSSFATNEYGYKKLGNVVNIKSKDKNGNSVYILYCHLDKVYVKKGDKIRHGQKIALSGSTGNGAEILDDKGKLIKGIRSKYWHCHIEACSNGVGVTSFYGKDRLQPEDYMKTKFDENGNAIK